MAPSEKSPPPVTKEKKNRSNVFFWLPTYLYFPHVKGWKKSLSFLVVERWEGPAGGRHQSLWQTEGSVVSGFFLPQPFPPPFGGRRRRQRKSNPPSFLPSFLPPPLFLDAPRIDKLTSHKKPRAKRYEKRQFYYAKLTKYTVPYFHILQLWYLSKDCCCILYICPVEKSMRKHFFFQHRQGLSLLYFLPHCQNVWQLTLLLSSCSSHSSFPIKSSAEGGGWCSKRRRRPNFTGVNCKYSIAKNVGFGWLWLQVYASDKVSVVFWNKAKFNTKNPYPLCKYYLRLRCSS